MSHVMMNFVVATGSDVKEFIACVFCIHLLQMKTLVNLVLRSAI